MTTPVITRRASEGERMEMTTPVYTKRVSIIKILASFAVYDFCSFVGMFLQLTYLFTNLLSG